MATMNTNSKAILSAVIFVATLFATATAIYYSISIQGYLPEFPKVSTSVEEAEKSIAGLFLRTKDMSLTEKEKDFVNQLEELHLAETNELSDPPSLSIEKRVENLQRSLSEAARDNIDRFLLLGDFLAARFHSALEALLSEKQGVAPNRSTAVMRVNVFGGAFYKQAIERGIIDNAKGVNGSVALPQIMFRYRWRLLADLKKDLEFSDFEKRVLLDFVARFSNKHEASKRLNAVTELAQMDLSYDIELASALILSEAGRTHEALLYLEDAISGKPDNKKLKGLYRLLQETLNKMD